MQEVKSSSSAEERKRWKSVAKLLLLFFTSEQTLALNTHCKLRLRDGQHVIRVWVPRFFAAVFSGAVFSVTCRL
jgi:hypothetical protein